MFRFFHFAVRHPLYPYVRATPAQSSWGQPMAVSGTFQELTFAALRCVRPRLAVYVFQNEDEPLLTDAQRDELWEKFRVPVYVLLLDRNRRVCGYECEAHQGLHLPAHASQRGISSPIETAPCGCGRPGPRALYPSPPRRHLPVAG